MAFEEENKNNHLEELNGSGYQIVEGEPDITGWDVIDGGNRKIGEVADVLFDPQTRDVRYIIVDLDDNELDIDTDKKVLIPIGIAELRNVYDEDATETGTIEEPNTTDENLAENDNFDDDELVYLPTITAEQLLALPSYEKGSLSPENETAIRTVFQKPSNDAIIVYDKSSFYSHEHFNNKLYNDQRFRNSGTTNFSENTDESDSGSELR